MDNLGMADTIAHSCQACMIAVLSFGTSGRDIAMAGYKLATYQSADGPRAGVIVDDTLFDAAKLAGKPAYTAMLAILADWSKARGVLKAAAAKAGKGKLKGQPV